MEDLYDDSPSPATSGKAPDAPKKDGDSGKTALIDSSICPGMEPGEKLTVTIVAAHDKEYTVRYDKEEESSEPTKDDEASEMSSMKEPVAAESSGGMYD